MRIEIVDTYAALSQRAADIAADVIRRRPDAVLGLPTGSTPEGFYGALVQHAVSFRRVRTFNLDEYIGLEQTHPQSYHTFMQQHLYSKVDVTPANLHIPNGMASDVDEECRRYEDAMREAGGLDLVVLGLGLNGHIGFNEPGAPWDAPTHRAALTAETRQANARFFGSVENVPREAITIGIGTMLKAKQILLLASGAAKAEIVKRTLEGEPSGAVPSTVLQRHGNVTVLLDTDAAAALERKGS